MSDVRPDYSTIRTTATKAIRLKCLDCCGTSSKDVRDCAIKACPLWRYRQMGEQKDILYYQARQGPKVAVYEGSGEVEMASDEEDD